ncbi:MAG: glycosyltransferase [Candidatus Micrarchaeota archaeon]|nr:glycosyltransferase [Candidatus Micrarchaeota archaeon]
MAKKRIDVSVIVPSYNEEKYIGACLAAIRRQKFSGTYEIIVGDGHSKDRTQKISRDYGARVVEENFGTASGGRYRAAKIARGRIYAFMSADVEPCQGWLQNIYDAFENKRVAWAVGSVKPIEGRFVEEIGAAILNFFASVLNRVGLAYVNGDNVASRADAYWKCGGFNPRLTTSEDTDLGMRLMRQGRFAYAGRATVLISMRRVRKWGYLNFALFHTKNFASTHFLKTPAKMYAPIR